MTWHLHLVWYLLLLLLVRLLSYCSHGGSAGPMESLVQVLVSPVVSDTREDEAATSDRREDEATSLMDAAGTRDDDDWDEDDEMKKLSAFSRAMPRDSDDDDIVADDDEEDNGSAGIAGLLKKLAGEGAYSEHDEVDEVDEAGDGDMVDDEKAEGDDMVSLSSSSLSGSPLSSSLPVIIMRCMR